MALRPREILHTYMHQLRGLATYRRGYWSFDPEDSRNSGTTAQSEGDTKAIVWIPHGHEREQSPEQLQSDSSLIIVATGSAKYSPQLKQRRLPARHYAFARETGRDPLLPVLDDRFGAVQSKLLPSRMIVSPLWVDKTLQTNEEPQTDSNERDGSASAIFKIKCVITERWAEKAKESDREDRHSSKA